MSKSNKQVQKIQELFKTIDSYNKSLKKPRIFWLQADNKDIQTFEYFASEEQSYDDDIKVVELTPLIAAAPEMLEALEAINSLVWDQLKGTKHQLALIEICEQAIAKAKGESHE